MASLHEKMSRRIAYARNTRKAIQKMRRAADKPARIKEWSYQNDVFFSDAIKAMREDIRQGTSFEGSLSHYSDLFNIEESALRHEWNLRNEDDR